MTVQNIHIISANPTLERLITEQLSLFKNLALDPIQPPDLIILQQGQTAPVAARPVPILDIPKGAVRMGDITDKLNYLLSGRDLHIENDNENIDLGEFLLIPAENLLVHQASEEEIRLTDKERLLLRFLYEAGDNGLSRKALLKDVWGYADDAETHTLETHMYRLRQKIEAVSTHNLIKAIDGLYKMDMKKPAD